jgi:hypothetical protein
MARIPRYQESGVISADVPSMSFPMASTSQAVGKSLDQLMQFAFGEIKERKDKEDKIIAAQMRSELELEVAKKVNDLDTLVSTGQLTDARELQSEIRSLESFARPLFDRDVTQAAGLIQSITSSGKALMAKSTDMMLKNYSAARNVITDDAIKQNTKLIERLWETTASYEDPAMGEQARTTRNVEEQSIFSKMFNVARMNPGSSDEKMTQFLKSVEAAKINVISKYLKDELSQGNMTILNAKMAAGDYGKYTRDVMSFTEEQKSAIRTAIKKRFVESTDILKAEAELKKSGDETEARALIADYFSSPKPATLEKLRAIAIRSGAVSPEYVAELPNKVSGAEPRNVMGEMMLKDEIQKGLITSLADFQNRGRSLGVGIRRLSELQDNWYSGNRSVENDIEGIARAQARLVPGQTNISQRQQQDYYKFISNVEDGFQQETQAWKDGGSKGPAPSKRDIANKLVVKRRESIQSRKIDNITDSLISSYGPQGTVKKSNIDFNNIEMQYSKDGEAVGLSSDVKAALRRDRFSDDQIDDIEQKMIGLDKQRKELSTIR